jgi:hypothetical protein
MGNEGSGVFNIGLKWIDGKVAGVGKTIKLRNLQCGRLETEAAACPHQSDVTN